MTAQPLPWRHWLQVPFLLSCGCTAVGCVAVGVDPKPAAFGFHVTWVFGVSIVTGALFWLMLHHVVDAGWSVVVRRPLEHLTLAAVPLAALGVVAGLLVPSLFTWATATDDPILDAKRWWLNRPFFLTRLALYVAVWTFFALRLRHWSAQQDTTADTAPTERARFHSPSGLVILAVTTTLFAFDWIMALDYHWQSTMMGVLFWAGAILGSLAAWTLAVCVLDITGVTRGVVTAEHRHDLGKYLLAFTAFWAYIAFSQYFLIWYANLAEETPWYLRRLEGGWRGVSYALALGQFVIPFLLLLPRAVKRSSWLLGGIAAWQLAFHYLDLYYQIAPAAHHEGGPHPSVWDAVWLIAVVAGFVAIVAGGLRRWPLVPANDVRLDESLHFTNTE